MSIYPLSALRSVALYASGLSQRNGGEAPVDQASIMAMVGRLGAVQIDTLQMVARAHYLTLWSRLGTYDPALLDGLGNEALNRKIFEGFFHAACFIPLEEYRYQLPRQRLMREKGHNWYSSWYAEPGNKELITVILAKVREEGALRANSIEGEKLKHGSWWDWRPEKLALEHLVGFGDLMIAGRQKFQRIYDLTERVLPDWVDTSEPSAEERDLYWLERGAKALGVGYHRNAADYTWMKLGTGRPLIARLIREGRLLEVKGETLAGVETLLVHPDYVELLERAAAGDTSISPQRTTFLNPFDNLWWAQGRDEAFWGFRQRLEAYYPASKRVYGYFCLPILHKDRLVGRFDPKLERKTGRLLIKALHLEPGVEPDEQLVTDVAAAMRDFMKFHQAKELVIEKCSPQWFGEKLGREFND